MNIFEKFLEIKTWNKNLLIKAAFIENAKKHWEWAFYIYYYDVFTHTFYINDLYRCKTKASSINLVENILNKAYIQEMYSLVGLMKLLLMNKKPNVYCLYEENKTKEVVIDKVEFEIIKNKDWAIESFKNPRWIMSLEDTLKNLGLK